MPPDRDLDRELRDLGPRVEYPPVPDLARSVRGRLEAESTGASARTRPQVWWIAAAALLLLVAVPVVSLAVRGTGGGVLSGAGGGAAVESGGQEAGDAGPTRLARDAAAGPTHLAEEGDESLAAGAGGGAPSSSAAGSEASVASASAEAACAFPASLLQIQPNKGAPGTGFVLRGENFVDAAARTSSCDDTPPFNRESDAGSRLAPPGEVRLDFRQGGRTWRLGVVRPGRTLGFRVQLRVPEDARPGAATITATGEGVLDPSEVSFQVSPK